MSQSSRRDVWWGGRRPLSVTAVLLMMVLGPRQGFAATYTGKATEDVEKEEKPVAGEQVPPAPLPGKPLTRDQIFQAIKLRAQRELARQRASPWSFHTYATWTGGNENNPNLTRRHKSDGFMEEYLSYTLGYRLLPQMLWQASYSLDAFNYSQYTDLNTLTNSLSTKLFYQIAKPVRVEAHYTFEDLAYPNDHGQTTGSSSWNQKIHLRLRHTFLKNYYHYVGWTYLFKQYEDRLIRNGAGTRIAGKRRKDRRHTGTYEIGGRFGENLNLRVRQDFYFNNANDHFQDFYNSQDYKVRVSGTYHCTPRWSTSGGFAYELKRYEGRVNTAPRPVKQRDYTKTYDVGLTYQLNENLNLSYTLLYARNKSNEATQKYTDVTNSFALTCAF